MKSFWVPNSPGDLEICSYLVELLLDITLNWDPSNSNKFAQLTAEEQTMPCFQYAQPTHDTGVVWYEKIISLQHTLVFGLLWIKSQK